MQIQTNTGPNITGSEGLAAQAKTIVEGALTRFSDQITRVEIHLSDENGPRGVEQAMDGAADKLQRSIESTLGRLRDDQ